MAAPMEMGDRLRQARDAAGIKTAADAAKRFGWRPSTYSAHENGQNQFSVEQCSEYAAAYRVSRSWLAWGEGTSAGPAPAGGTPAAILEPLLREIFQALGLAPGEALRLASAVVAAASSPRFRQSPPTDSDLTDEAGSLIALFGPKVP